MCLCSSIISQPRLQFKSDLPALKLFLTSSIWDLALNAKALSLFVISLLADKYSCILISLYRSFLDLLWVSWIVFSPASAVSLTCFLTVSLKVSLGRALTSSKVRFKFNLSMSSITCEIQSPLMGSSHWALKNSESKLSSFWCRRYHRKFRRLDIRVYLIGIEPVSKKNSSRG